MNIYDTHGNLLYASKAETMRKTVEEAVGVGADLTEASLAGENLAYATLTNANLTRANLAYATLAYATLTNASLYNANIDGTIGIIDGGMDSRGYRWAAVQHDDGPRIFAGCRWFTVAEAHEHWDGEHPRGEDVAAECRARLALLETLAKSRGWIQ